jgi:hypothetical protein
MPAGAKPKPDDRRIPYGRPEPRIVRVPAGKPPQPIRQPNGGGAR